MNKDKLQNVLPNSIVQPKQQNSTHCFQNIMIKSLLDSRNPEISYNKIKGKPKMNGATIMLYSKKKSKKYT